MIQWHFLICIVSFCMLYSLFVNVLYICLLAYRIIVYFTTSMVYLLSPGHISITGTDHIELLLFQACKCICHVISSSFPKLVLFAVKCHCNSQVFIYEKKNVCVKWQMQHFCSFYELCFEYNACIIASMNDGPNECCVDVFTFYSNPIA